VSYVFFSDTYIPHPDGVAHSVAWSAQALRDLGKDVVIVRPDDGSSRSSAYELPLPSNPAPFRDYYVSWSSYIRSAGELLERSMIGKGEIEVIHVHSLGPIGMLGLRCAWTKSIPAVLSWHTDLLSYADIYPEIYLGALAARLQMMVYWPHKGSIFRDLSMAETIRTILHSVDCVVAPSVKTAKHLSLLCPEARITLVPTGLPDYVFRYKDFTPSRMRDVLHIRTNDEVVLSVGRLSAEKNPSLLISSFRAIQSIRRNVKCIAVGDPGPSQNGLKWQLELRNNGAIVLPSMRHTELLELYRAANLLLVTSLTETQGLTVLEAHAVGLPVVCVDPGLEWFGDAVMPNVLVAKTATPEDIVNASIRVLDEISGKPTHADANSAYSSLTSRTQGEKFIELYEQLYRCRKMDAADTAGS
jgi:glycosyltransferase involved in cell wall biosynthesis